jgi:hypothetical protein
MADPDLDAVAAAEIAAATRSALAEATIAANVAQIEAEAAASLAASVETVLTLPDNAAAAAESAQVQVDEAQAAADAVDPDDAEALAAATTSLAAANDYLETASAAAETYSDRDAYVEGLVTRADTANEAAATAAAASEEAATAAAEAAPAAESARVVVFNPATGAVITEGGDLLVESTFTDTGGMRIEVPNEGGDYTEAAAAAEEATAAVDEAVAAVRVATVDAQMAALTAASDETDTAAVAAAEEAAAAVAELQAVAAAAQVASDEAEAARLAESATVTVSADGTQQSIRDANGNTATSITSDTGVLITMGLTSMGQALDNLAAGDVQPVLATDGAELAAGVDADGNLVFRMPDGTEAATADGEAYTADDLTALRLIFSIG